MRRLFPWQVPPMPRLTIMAKGNADVRGSLHALHENDTVTWNGLNALVRDRHPGWVVRVIHETMTRSDALLAPASAPPASLAERVLPLGPFSVASQFATELFDKDADVVVLSIQPDVMNRVVKHRADGHLFYPYDAEAWSAEDRAWLVDRYLPEASLEPLESMANLAEITARIRQRGDPIILIYNLSPIVPWERLHCYQGLSETLAERIRRFNLALVDLSRSTGVSIVDVDSVVARVGADRVKLDTILLNAEGCRLVAEEVLRILEDQDCFVQAEAA